MKVLVGVLLVVFVGWWMVQSPDQLAEFTRDGAAWAWDMTETIFGGLSDFLGALFE
jgi:hypothetical protein